MMMNELLLSICEVKQCMKQKHKDIKSLQYRLESDTHDQIGFGYYYALSS